MDDQSTQNLLPASHVWRRYNVCDRTIDRWLANEKLSFPKPIVIQRRRYWKIGDLVAWERARAKAA